MPSPPNPAGFPVVAQPDVLVVGGTSAAVACALAAREAGASVFLVAPRPYLGDDICAAFRFWPSAPATGLAAEVFGSGAVPPTPLHVKLTLEQRMVEAGIPFLLQVFPCALLQDARGRTGGVLLANRTGRQAILARTVVDASLDGLLSRLAGVPGARTPSGPIPILHTTLCEGGGAAASGPDLLAEPPGFAGPDVTLSARTYRLTVDAGDGSPSALAAAATEASARCWVKGEYRHQSVLTPAPEAPPAATIPDPESCEVGPGRFALSEAVALPGDGQAALTDPVSAMTAGTALGAWLGGRNPPEADRGSLRAVCAGARPLPSGELRTLRDALRPGQAGDMRIELDADALPVLGRFDVVVAGGGTGGVSAAIGAARTGASAAILEITSGLGGVGTMGQIASYWFGNRVGWTSEIDRGVAGLETNPVYAKGTGKWSVAAKSAWYLRTAHGLGVSIWFHTVVAGVWVDGGRVRGVVVAGPLGYGLVEAGCVVDSTGCSDIPAAAGAPTVSIGAEHLAVQGTGLAGIDPGREYRNSDHDFSDDTDIVDTTTFLVAAKLKFRGAFDCGELVDSRERRQIVGDATLGPADFLYERRFPDTICIASSNFDSHGFTIHPVFHLIPPDKQRLWADVPFRCLLPRGLDGVLVTGLGVSAHRDALPVIRMQADVQNQGYAAGRAAAMSARAGIPVRDIDVKALQRHLVDIGNLPERVLTDRDSFPPTDDTLREAVETGGDRLRGLALIFALPDRARPFVRDAFARAASGENRVRLAQILALLGDGDGADVLAESVRAATWDEGWNFRGMHQFGMSLSPLDARIIALGEAGGPDAWPALLGKIATLPADPAFSHCRAVVMACEALHRRHPDPRAAPALAAVLRRPGLGGHAQRDIRAALASLTDDPNENLHRNLALREIHLARGILRCGDPDGIGAEVLRAYADDRRGHFARHARALLASNGCPGRDPGA